MYPDLASAAVWIVALATLLGILVRPFRSSEWHWAAGGAIALIAMRLTSPGNAWGAIVRGTDVYAFLIGILLLAEVARAEGVFKALAFWAVGLTAGSPRRLLPLVYLAGVAVTALLSNDTTIIVLTPAVLAIVEPSGADPMPYLYACAFVANAASFVFPFSNPANFVIYDRSLPPLVPWLADYGLAAAASIAVTYVALRIALRRDLGSAITRPPCLSARRGRGVAAACVATSAAVLVAVAALGWNVALAALSLGIATCAATATVDAGAIRSAVKRTPWQIVPLVAGLFVVVDAIDRGGALAAARRLLLYESQLGAPMGTLLAAASAAVASNVANNLPVALAAGYAFRGIDVAPSVAHATLIGVDLGPNVAVTGSLATLLWLVILRREGHDVSPFSFLRLGLATCVPALIAAALLLR